MKEIVLHGPRIRLRPIEEKDAEVLVQLAQDPTMAPNLGFFAERAPTLEEELGWVRTMRKSMERKGPDFVFTIETSDGENLIGTVGLHEIDYKNHNARVGMLIANKDFREKGYATEILIVLYDYVFEVLGFRKLYMSFRVDNEKQRHLAEKLGYREVGVLKEEYFWRGQYLDFVRYELLASTWFARRSGQ